ncbi:glycosyltransferase [Pseudomonadales bacterium]|nr:glycosyltransferase [Pseudomonadales bacterium]
MTLGWWRAFAVGDADLVHTTGILPDCIGLFLSLWRPWVVTVRNYPSDDYPPKFGEVLGGVLARIHFFILRHCRSLVFCSYDLERKFSEVKITGSCVENASIDFFGVPAEFDKALLYCGSLIKRKNIDATVKLYKESGKLKSLDFLVYGEGDQAYKFSSTSRVQQFGFENDIYKIYAKPRVFISLSRSEGMPNSALEAIAGGCLLILSNIPPHKRLASIFPELVMLIEPDDIDLKEFDVLFDSFIKGYGNIDWTKITDRYTQTYGVQRMQREYLKIYCGLSNES